MENDAPDDNASAHAFLLEAIERAGSQGRLATICGCTAPNIWQLVRGKRALPARFVLRVEAELKVSRHDLRPDIYPRAKLGRAA